MTSVGANEPVCAGIGLGLVVVCDTADNDRTNSPEHLQHLRGWGSEAQRDDLAAVGWCVGDENTPRDSLQKLSSEENRERVGKVGDEDHGVEEHEAEQRRQAIANATGYWTGEEDAKEGSELT